MHVRLFSRWLGMSRFFYHHREMAFQMAENIRSIIAHEEPRLEPEKWWTWLAPNGAGRRKVIDLCYCFKFHHVSYFKSGCLARLRPRIVLAAEKWRRAHGGKNPPTLDTLVPEYLAAVPRDPWSKSSAPINYEAALGVAWSVGKEGKYDYRKIATDHAVGTKASVDGDTQKYAFRLDGKPIGFHDSTERGAVHPQ